MLLYQFVSFVSRGFYIHGAFSKRAEASGFGVQGCGGSFAAIYICGGAASFIPRETLIKSLSDFTLEFLGIARNNLTRIASYLRKAVTKLCIKILVEADSAI